MNFDLETLEMLACEQINDHGEILDSGSERSSSELSDSSSEDSVDGDEFEKEIVTDFKLKLNLNKDKCEEYKPKIEILN